MNLQIDTRGRSRLFLAMLRALEVDDSDTVEATKRNALAELVSFYPDKMVLVIALVTVLQKAVDDRNGVASIEQEELEWAMNGDTVAARLVAGLLGLVAVHDPSVDIDYYHTVGVPTGRISSDTVIVVADRVGDDDK